MKDKNVISFSPTTMDSSLPNYNNPPIQSTKVIPDWYRDLVGFRGSSSNSIRYLNPINDRGQDGSDVSTKQCPPFMDAMISGYMQVLGEDLLVEIMKDEKPSISWQSDQHIVDVRPAVDMPIPKECYPIHFGWKMSWYYETPPGYSLLITQPFNRFDLPFYSPAAIVDSDIWGLPAFMPFFLKRGFSGIIPKGTPIFQMIPVKRDDWELNIDLSEETYWKNREREEKRRSHVTGHYKKTTWQKKNY